MGDFDNMKFSKEFMEQTITISAYEMCKLVVEQMSVICHSGDITDESDPRDIALQEFVYNLLKVYSSALLAEMFDVDGKLEIDPKDDKE
jgi:hypothetical protein